MINFFKKIFSIIVNAFQPVKKAALSTHSPSWYRLAKSEMGQKEIPGPNHNERIVEYHSRTSLKAPDDETPWCMSFVNWCLENAGYEGTNKPNARSVMTSANFIQLDKPKLGCIVVLWRGHPTSWKGHVGFLSADRGNRVDILGGNQNDMVNVMSYPAKRVLGYYWPTES